jgi:hypothetical protein
MLGNTSDVRQHVRWPDEIKNQIIPSAYVILFHKHFKCDCTHKYDSEQPEINDLKAEGAYILYMPVSYFFLYFLQYLGFLACSVFNRIKMSISFKVFVNFYNLLICNWAVSSRHLLL